MGIYDEDMTIQMVNSGLEKLSGYSKKELEGRMKWTEFVAKQDLERMIRYHQERRKRGKNPPSEYEFRFINRKGEAKDIFFKINTIPGTRKGIASLVDITARNN